MRFYKQEWLREPMSKMEKTLRLPWLIIFSLEIFITRFVFKAVLIAIFINLILENITIAIFIGVIGFFVYELFLLEKYFSEKVLPRHLENLSKAIEKLEKSKENLESKDIEDITKKSAWGIINIGYISLASFGWELIFRVLYPVLTSTNVKYTTLLSGFQNKSNEADQFLWNISQMANGARKKKLLKEYIDKYGSRVSDIDIGKPTLREHAGAIEKLVSLYKGTISPNERLARASKNREANTIEIGKRLKVPKKVFIKLLTKVQSNVKLREDRRFYEFLFDYHLRTAIIKYAERKHISKNKVFTMSWKELKYA